MKKSPGSFPRDSLKKIERLSRRVAKPASYLRGRTSEHSMVPRNIICFVRRDAAALTQPHFKSPDQHHRFVLIAAIHGTGEVGIDARRFLLREGQAQLIFPFQFHSYLSVRPARICWIFVTFEMEKKNSLDLLRSSPPRDLGAVETELLAGVIRNWTEGEPPELLQLQLALLLTRFTAHKPGKGANGGDGVRRDEDILFQVNRHLLARIERPIAIKTMAAALGLSESHLRRRFRVATGLSLGRHVRELRLQRSCGLLQDGALSVGEVAGRCGFDSIYSFSRAFKNSLGLSPRGYRSRWKTPE